MRVGEDMYPHTFSKRSALQISTTTNTRHSMVPEPKKSIPVPITEKPAAFSSLINDLLANESTKSSIDTSRLSALLDETGPKSRISLQGITAKRKFESVLEDGDDYIGYDDSDAQERKKMLNLMMSGNGQRNKYISQPDDVHIHVPGNSAP